ncbi:hypothetical protein JTE90_004469 [Oedothorax gibbosus]|uniref:BTB domain-containing protein n=1 Tax=Oedothorax gibbosus TaxID=931172 RepID=A0AAV6UBC4_9ARAC|nr:hypothetical protein JTE90_004469 [Oedothorax gibbosus]
MPKYYLSIPPNSLELPIEKHCMDLLRRKHKSSGNPSIVLVIKSAYPSTCNQPPVYANLGAISSCTKKQNGREEVVSNESDVGVENVGEGKENGKVKKRTEKSTAHTKTYITPGKEQPNHRNFQMTRSDVNLTKKATNKLTNVSRIRPDVTIVIKDREFRLHKKVLCEESSYFSKMMDPNSSRQYTLKLDGKLNTSPDIFHYIMTFLYCGEMEPNKVSTLETICSASRVLGIQRAVDNSLEEISCHRNSLTSALRSYCFRCATNGGKNSHFMYSLTSPCNLASNTHSKTQTFRNESESYWNNTLFTSVRGYYGQRIAMPYYPNHLKALPEKFKKKPTFEYLEYVNMTMIGLYQLNIRTFINFISNKQFG